LCAKHECVYIRNECECNLHDQIRNMQHECEVSVEICLRDDGLWSHGMSIDGPHFGGASGCLATS